MRGENFLNQEINQKKKKKKSKPKKTTTTTTKKQQQKTKASAHSSQVEKCRLAFSIFFFNFIFLTFCGLWLGQLHGTGMNA